MNTQSSADTNTTGSAVSGYAAPKRNVSVYPVSYGQSSPTSSRMGDSFHAPAHLCGSGAGMLVLLSGHPAGKEGVIVPMFVEEKW